MKKFAVLMLLLSILVFSGCESSEENQSYSSSDFLGGPPQSTTSSENSSDPDFYSEWFTFSHYMNVFREKGGVSPCAFRFDVPEGEFLSLEVWMGVKPDKSMPQENVPVRVYVIGDGVPIDFSIESSFYNGELQKMHELYVAGDDSDIIYDVIIPKDEIKDVTVLSIFTNYFPEYIPKKGTGAFGGMDAYTMTNSAKTTEYFRQNAADDGDYYITNNKEIYDDIGTVPLSELPNGDAENHLYNDVEVTSEDQPLYIKFNSGEDAEEYSYDIMLIRDGELLPAFDGEYSLRVNCNSGERTLQYRIPPEFLGEDGLHTFSFVAIPAFLVKKGPQIPFYTVCTTKIRVLVNREE